MCTSFTFRMHIVVLDDFSWDFLNLRFYFISQLNILFHVLMCICCMKCVIERIKKQGMDGAALCLSLQGKSHGSTTFIDSVESEQYASRFELSQSALLRDSIRRTTGGEKYGVQLLKL